MAYVTSASTKGGRNGPAMLDHGGLALAGDGHNPEQLFALGYSACFGQAILVIAQEARRRRPGREGHGGRHAEHRRWLLACCRTQGFDTRRRQGQGAGRRRGSSHDMPLFEVDKGNIPVKLTVV